MFNLKPVDTKVIIDRVKDYGPKPRSPKDVLQQARDLLKEEGQWMTGEFFEDGDAKEAYENASCGSWSACAMGAIGLVAGEMTVSVNKYQKKLNDGRVEELWRSAVVDGKTVKSLDAWRKENKTTLIEEEYFWQVNDTFMPASSPLTTKAAQFLGYAIVKDSDDWEDMDENDRLHDIVGNPDHGIQTVIDFNDSQTSRDNVIDAFDRAIELAKTGKLPKLERLPY